MSDYDDLVVGLGATNYWRCNEGSGALADVIGGRTMLAQGTPEYGVAGPSIDGDTAIRLNVPSGGTDYFRTQFNYNLFSGATQFSFVIWATTDAEANRSVFSHRVSASQQLAVSIDSATNTANLLYVNGTDVIDVDFSDGTDFTGWRMIGFSFDSGAVKCYLGGGEAATDSVGFTTLFSANALMHIGNFITTTFSGSIAKVATFRGVVLSGSDFAELYAAAGITGPSIVPLLLSSFVTSPAASIPLRLLTITASPAASILLSLESADPSHYLAKGETAARWGVAITIDGTDVSGRLLGPVTIRHEENASSECRLTLRPATGTIDPADYEHKRLRVWFVGLGASGAELYRYRRYTGKVATATYDPDAGNLELDATTDLQGRLENLPREAIDGIVGGLWSPHVFDEGADGWQYTQDRLLTRPAEIHVDVYGRLQVVDWAAKATADITLTDAWRFGGTLRLVRANRRDLISRIRINLDFRFVRLRHREIVVRFLDSLGFCHYLHNGWVLPSKDMIRGAADANEWTRVSDIAFVDLPPAGTYCEPVSGWAGGADAFCLAASWRAARRWAQTVTEEYALDVIAPDLEEAIGIQAVAEDYGVEATYDGTDYEALRAYESTPFGAVYSAATEDWQKDATDAEYDGRVAMEAAQACALAKAAGTICQRARGNRVSLDPLYRPDISLSSTVEIDTPYLATQGKVTRIDETLDPSSGALRQSIELAVSRHNGSGLAVADDLDAADAPDQPAEESTGRSYNLWYRLGGITNCPPDDEDWDGYMCNVTEALRAVGAPVYRPRFVLRMPEIEEAARDALSIAQPVSYEIEVPNDPLTMSV